MPVRGIVVDELRRVGNITDPDDAARPRKRKTVRPLHGVFPILPGIHLTLSLFIWFRNGLRYRIR
jgi:hypothetical protein